MTPAEWIPAISGTAVSSVWVLVFGSAPRGVLPMSRLSDVEVRADEAIGSIDDTAELVDRRAGTAPEV